MDARLKFDLFFIGCVGKVSASGLVCSMERESDILETVEEIANRDITFLGSSVVGCSLAICRELRSELLNRGKTALLSRPKGLTRSPL